MTDQLKRLGYGFLALVLAVSAIGAFPYGNAKALEGEEASEVSQTSDVNLGVAGTTTEGTSNEATANTDGDSQMSTEQVEQVSDDSSDSSSDEDWSVNMQMKFIKVGTDLVVEDARATGMTAYAMNNSYCDDDECLDSGEMYYSSNAVRASVESALSGAAAVSADAQGEFLPYRFGYGYGFGYGYPTVVEHDEVVVVPLNDGKFAVRATVPGNYMVMLHRDYMPTTILNLVAYNLGGDASGAIEQILANYEAALARLQEASKAAMMAGDWDAVSAAYDEFWAAAEADAARFSDPEVMYDIIWALMYGAGNEGYAVSAKVVSEKLALVNPEARAAIEKALKAKDEGYLNNITYYDVYVSVMMGENEIGKMAELGRPAKVVLGTFGKAPAGYTRKFIVSNYHIGADGTPTTEIIEAVNYDEATGNAWFYGSRFSTYAVAYIDVLSATPATGAFTGEAGSVAVNIAGSVVAVIAAIVLGGAAIFAKRK